LKKNRAIQACLGAAALTTAAVGTAGPAFAADSISPPEVTASPVAFYTVGTPITLTFSSTVGVATQFEYVLNGGATETVPAADGSATLAITPAARTTTITVYAVAADGTVSGPTYEDYLADNDTTAAQQDLNGDGTPDLLTIGDTAGLAPGLWQALGTGTSGKLATPATNIGVDGIGIGTDDDGSQAATLDGGEAVMGNFTADGFTDVLVYFPTGNDAGGAAVMHGPGNGSVPQFLSGNEVSVPSVALADPFTGDSPIDVADGYDAAGLGSPFDALFGISGDATNGYVLDYAESYGAPGAYGAIQLSTAKTPDDTGDWNDWQITTTKVASGVAMYLWNESTGALYLWEGVTVTDNGDQTGDLAYARQYKISSDWNKGAALSSIEAADFSGSGTPDLWAVTPAGEAKAYVVCDLSATTGTGSIRLTHSENLS
jgi:hypothetical protein